MSDKPKKPLIVQGFQIFKEQIDSQSQKQILSDLRGIVAQAPLFSPLTPSGKSISVKMTSAGKYGWFSDKGGYRYVKTHPAGVNWPKIPESISTIWQQLVSKDRDPDCCLINFYTEKTKMGLHLDNDESDYNWPVLSISLGDDALFRMGGQNRNDKTSSIWLSSGDVVVLGGDARLAYHGVDRIKFGTSQLLSQGGRINLTLRVVD